MNYYFFAHRTAGYFDESVQEDGENTGGEDSSYELVLNNEIIPPQFDRYSTPKSKKQNLASSEDVVTSDPDKAF